MAYKVVVYLFLATFLIGNRLTSAVNRQTDAPVANQCTIGTLYKSSLPSGGSGVEHLTVLGVGMTADQCISECCSLGPGGCQYLWVLEGTCIAVACESTKLSSCKPKMVSASLTNSVYVLMEHPQQESNELENALDWVNKVMLGSKGGDKESGDSPPNAATSTDEIDITLPDSEVYIYGNNSKDDKGISSYSWKLLTEHFVQPILENANQAILHVYNLIPGTYQFSLTVTDTTGQSGRTTVLIRVNKDPTELTTAEVSTHTPTTTTTTGSPPPLSQSGSFTVLLDTTPGSEGGNSTASIEENNLEKFYTKRRNVLKIVIPVLLSLAVLLVVTAAITTACACCCEKNRHRMKRYYRYKKLPETIEKT